MSVVPLVLTKFGPWYACVTRADAQRKAFIAAKGQAAVAQQLLGNVYDLLDELT